MMSVVDEILGDKGSELTSALLGVGLNSDEASSFLPPAAGKVLELITGGDLDVFSLLSKIDRGSLAAESGVSADKVSSGLQALVPVLLSVLQDKAGGVEGILSLLGGGDKVSSPGALGRLAGKFFNR
jgi:hypothetical protein